MPSIRINANLKLEPVTMIDAGFLFELKNEAGARASALVTKEPIKWEDHVTWLEKTLQREDVELYTIQDASGKRLGSWRFDHYPEHEEFAMVLDPAARGKRIGSTVFNFCSDYIQRLTHKTIVGYIAEGNVPPMRYHIGAGYTLESYDPERKCYRWTRDRAAFLVRACTGFC